MPKENILRTIYLLKIKLKKEKRVYKNKNDTKTFSSNAGSSSGELLHDPLLFFQC